MSLRGDWLITATNQEIITRLGMGPQTMDAAIVNAADRLQEIWQEVLLQPGSGTHWDIGFRVVDGILIPIRGADGYDNQSALPNQFPATQSGELAGSINVMLFPGNNAAKVGPHPDQEQQAFVLEFGAGPSYPSESPAMKQSGEPVIIEPRPHGRVALAMAQREMEEAAAEGIKTFLDTPSIRTVNLSDIRQKLLGATAFLGNLQALGIAPNKLFRIRTALFGTEKVFGDIESAMDGNFEGRIKRRFAGKQLGRALGRMVPSGQGSRFGNRVIRNALGGQTGKILQKIK